MTATITVTLRTALATCIGLAFAASPSSSDATLPKPAGGMTWTVENCDDAGPGSLRQVLAGVGDGDSVDLTQLACSTLSLVTGELDVGVDDLTLTGAGLTITAQGASRVIDHAGSGTLAIHGVDLVYGSAIGGGSGGCLLSRGNLTLDHVMLRGCTAAAPLGPFAIPQTTQGGGAYAAGNITLQYSTVTDNVALLAGGSLYDSARGGGVAANGQVLIDHSTVSGNSVPETSIYEQGGGFWAGTDAVITASTVSGNVAYFGGAGITAGSTEQPTESAIFQSTISGNRAAFRTAGIASKDAILAIDNSTIAFNRVARGVGVGYLGGVGITSLSMQSVLSLESVIIADNTVDDGTADDLSWSGIGPGNSVEGIRNLVIAADMTLPDDTLHDDPMLAPLADNGGPTWTHALLPGSPAIDAGDNEQGYVTDQRGQPRVSGPAADIGAFEVQQPPPPEAIFADGFDGPA